MVTRPGGPRPWSGSKFRPGRVPAPRLCFDNADGGPCAPLVGNPDRPAEPPKLGSFRAARVEKLGSFRRGSGYPPTAGPRWTAGPGHDNWVPLKVPFGGYACKHAL